VCFKHPDLLKQAREACAMRREDLQQRQQHLPETQGKSVRSSRGHVRKKSKKIRESEFWTATTTDEEEEEEENGLFKEGKSIFLI